MWTWLNYASWLGRSMIRGGASCFRWIHVSSSTRQEVLENKNDVQRLGKRRRVFFLSLSRLAKNGVLKNARAAACLLVHPRTGGT